MSNIKDAAKKTLVGKGTPYGVIFDGEDKAYVGSAHGRKTPIAQNILSRIKSIGDKHGYWYEGNGGDIAPNKELFGNKKNYEGSWDDAFADKQDGYPYEFLSSLFANIAVNNQIDFVIDPSRTIFNSIIRNQEAISSLKGKDFNGATLTRFLKAVSQKGADFLQLSQQKATKDNTAKFFRLGEKLQNPPNWDDYPNPAGKVMKKAEDKRNSYVLSRPSGVFVMGAGHLPEIKRLNKSLTIIGGQKAKA